MVCGPAWMRRRVDVRIESAQVVADLERPEAVLAHVAGLERVALMTFLALERLDGHMVPFL